MLDPWAAILTSCDMLLQHRCYFLLPLHFYSLLATQASSVLLYAQCFYLILFIKYPASHALRSSYRQSAVQTIADLWEGEYWRNSPCTCSPSMGSHRVLLSSSSFQLMSSSSSLQLLLPLLRCLAVRRSPIAPPLGNSVECAPTRSHS